MLKRAEEARATGRKQNQASRSGVKGATSTVGSGGLEAKAWACGVELRIGDVVVREVSCISFPLPPFSVV